MWQFGTQNQWAAEIGPLQHSHSPQNSVNQLEISLLSTCQAVRELSKVLASRDDAGAMHSRFVLCMQETQVCSGNCWKLLDLLESPEPMLSSRGKAVLIFLSWTLQTEWLNFITSPWVQGMSVYTRDGCKVINPLGKLIPVFPFSSHTPGWEGIKQDWAQGRQQFSCDRSDHPWLLPLWIWVTERKPGRGGWRSVIFSWM